LEKNKELEPLEKKQEPEPLEKKSGAGAEKKFAGSPALIYNSYNKFKFKLY